MTAHKHALLMAMYAQDALTTDKPHLLWEYRGRDGQWRALVASPAWLDNWEYRRKPQTHMVNGFEVEAPVQHVDPTTAYYVAAPDIPSWVFYLGGADNRRQTLAGRGLVFATESAAIANAKAMVGVNPHTSCPCKD